MRWKQAPVTCMAKKLGMVIPPCVSRRGEVARGIVPPAVCRTTGASVDGVAGISVSLIDFAACGFAGPEARTTGPREGRKAATHTTGYTRLTNSQITP